jgi:hypothetical protein
VTLGVATTQTNSGIAQEANAAQEVPIPFLDKTITSFDATPFKVFWLNAGYCPAPLPISKSAPADEADRVTIGHVATHSGSSREVFNRHDAHDPGDCNPYEAYSNIVSDNNHVYWADNEGLVRLSHEANVGDEPELISAAVKSVNGERLLLAEGGDSIFTATYDLSGFFRLRKVFKGSGISILITSAADVRKLSYDGKYLYWLNGDELWRANQLQGIDFAVLKIGDDVTAYFAEGPQQCPPTCHEQVFIARSNHRVMLYNNLNGVTIGPIYAANAQDGLHQIYDLVADPNNLFVRQLRYGDCSDPGGCLNDFTDVLLRTTRSIGGEVELIDLEENVPLPDADAIVYGRITHSTEIIGYYLYFQRERVLYRLPKGPLSLYLPVVTNQSVIQIHH